MELTSCYAHTCMYVRANVSNFHCAKKFAEKFSPMAYALAKLVKIFLLVKISTYMVQSLKGEDSHEGEVGEIPPLGPM